MLSQALDGGIRDCAWHVLPPGLGLADFNLTGKVVICSRRFNKNPNFEIQLRDLNGYPMVKAELTVDALR